MKKHKVGLCIVYKNHNYGAVLQSYATVKKLEELNVRYEIIDYNHPKSISLYFHSLQNVFNRVTIYSKLRV